MVEVAVPCSASRRNPIHMNETGRGETKEWGREKREREREKRGKIIEIK